MKKTVLCSAPFHSITIDTDRRVKPCCNFAGHLGDLNKNSIQEIRDSIGTKSLQEDMLNNVWPEGCYRCKVREDQSGTSVRLNVYDKIEYDGNDSLKYLEYNSSNICNLSCSMCSPSWSSNLYQFYKSQGWDLSYDDPSFPKYKIYTPDLLKATEFINEISFENLETIWFKGGEPFLNKENLLLLEQLDRIGHIQNVTGFITTNCTVVDDRMLELISRLKDITIVCSIDGTEEINRYIRYGFGNPKISSLDNIYKNLKKFSQLNNLKSLSPAPTVQVLNIFDLWNFWQWWMSEIFILRSESIGTPVFEHFVFHPEYLSIRVLRDGTKNYLINYYRSLNMPEFFDKVINVLEQPYLGDELHDKFKNYILRIDKTRERTILDIEPRLKYDLNS